MQGTMTNLIYVNSVVVLSDPGRIREKINNMIYGNGVVVLSAPGRIQG